MWISKIELTNFKSYRHANFSFPEPAEGRNIVLIGGMNGYGKTSILEALYLCLYGKDSMAHLARAGLKTEDYRGYRTFLERAFNGEAKRDGADMMSARVVIQRNKTAGFDILRRWYFKAQNGQWLEEEAIVREVVRGDLGAPKTDGKASFQLSDLLDDHLVPAHIAPFFFFDGEEVKKLADQSRIEQVKQGLEGLLGVVLLRNLAERLRTFEGAKRSGISNSDDDNIDKLLKELTEEGEKLAALNTDESEAYARLDALKAERDSCIERITTLGGGGGDIAAVKDLVEEREQLRSAKADAHRKLERILGEKLPFHLMPKSLLLEFKKQLQREVALVDWEAECKALQPKRAKFERALLGAETPEISPELTPQQVAALKGRIEGAWASLFHPPPVHCADKVLHGYLHGDLRAGALDFLESISVGQQEIQELLGAQREAGARIDELNRKISRVEGIDHDGTLAELKATYDRLNKEVDVVDSRIREDERNRMAVEVTVTNLRARYQQEAKRRDESSPVRQLLEKSERVRSVIEEVVPTLFPLKVASLATSMTKVYKQLAHKDQVARITIDDDGTTHILGKTGKEIRFDRSAGENQIFATALIAGLAEVSGVKAPMVVDTPLGRLDSKHRKNIFKFWIGSPNRQVILLSQDEEIDEAFYETIEPSVSTTYLLEHMDVGDGIGRTTAREGAYFGIAS